MPRTQAEWQKAAYLMQHHPESPDIVPLLRTVVRTEPDNHDAKHWLGHALSYTPRGEAESIEVLSGVNLNRLTSAKPLVRPDSMLQCVRMLYTYALATNKLT